MGVSFRRSVKIGGVRFNLSKSGIGMSTGIKGLRFGVSSKGKPYISGGAGGVYFHENIGSAKNTLSEYHEEKKKVKSIRQRIMYTSALALGIGAFVYGVFKENKYFVFAGLALLVYIPVDKIITKIYRFISNKIMTRAVLELKQKIDALVTENNLDAIQGILGEIKEKKIPKEYLSVLFAEAYPVFIKNALADNELSAQELAIIEELKSGLDDWQFEYMNSEAVKIVFSEITADNKITAEEEAALYSILEKIHISQTAREGIDSAVSRHKELIAYYKKIGEEIAAQHKKIDALNENGLSRIAVDNPALKNLNCYYEGEASLLGKRKDRRGYYEYYEKGSGKLYVTDKDIQIMIDGHTVIGIDKIASLELDGDITSIIVSGRKTPLYIKAFEPVWLEALIKYIGKNK